MRGWLAFAVGLLAVVTGGLWTGQGLGVVPGSVMTGEAVWVVIGPVVALAGVALIVLGFRQRRR
jgi:hypothetical protein